MYELIINYLLYIIIIAHDYKRMGKFTKDKRVRKTHQYSNNVLHFFYSNLGYLL